MGEDEYDLGSSEEGIDAETLVEECFVNSSKFVDQ